MKKTDMTVTKDSAPVRRKRRRFTWDDLELTFLSLPTVLWFIAFCYIPLFGIVFAFKNYKVKAGKGFIYSLFVHSKWVGFKNFQFLLRSQDLANIFRNTLGYNVVFLLIGVTLPVALAITLAVQGFACSYIAIDQAKSDRVTAGIAGVIGAIIFILGLNEGLIIGLILCITMIEDPFNIKRNREKKKEAETSSE